MDTVTWQAMLASLRRHKRVYRIYRDLELNMRIKPRKRLKRESSDTLMVPSAPNHVWSMRCPAGGACTAERGHTTMKDQTWGLEV